MIVPRPASASVRFPWPDEHARLLSMFPAPAPDPARLRTWFWVLATEAPERLVGAIALHERRDAVLSGAPVGWLELAIKPAWRETAPAAELLNTAQQAARELHLSRLELDADPSAPLGRQLRERGFVAEPVQELWKVAPAEVWGEHGATLFRGLQRRSSGPIRSLTNEDLPGVRELCGHFDCCFPSGSNCFPRRKALIRRCPSSSSRVSKSEPLFSAVPLGPRSTWKFLRVTRT